MALRKGQNFTAIFWIQRNITEHYLEQMRSGTTREGKLS